MLSLYKSEAHAMHVRPGQLLTVHTKKEEERIQDVSQLHTVRFFEPRAQKHAALQQGKGKALCPSGLIKVKRMTTST